MKNFLIGGCVVLYNPTESVLDNINTYIPFLDELVVVDNSTEEVLFLEKIIYNSKIHYINLNGNQGIARALNEGLNYLYEKNYDFALTMDQDSKFPLNDFDEIKTILYNAAHIYSILGLNFNYTMNIKSTEIIDVNYWLTSGNFVNLNDYNEVGGFNDQLFIDYVDIEFGYRLKCKNKKIGYLRDYSLIHQIGNPIEIKIGNKTFYSMNHSPIRYYYRYRNCYYLYKKDRRFFKKEFVHEIFINIPKMLLYESQRKDKIKMIIAGIKDAWQQKLGKYGINK